MSLFDCIQRAMNDPEIQASKERGERAQAMWKSLSDRYVEDGFQRHTAEQLAAEDVKEAFRREAGEKRHVYLAVTSFQRKAQAHVAATTTPDLRRRMEQVRFKTNALVRLFNSQLDEYLAKHAPRIRDLATGKPRDLAEQIQIADELSGIASGNPNAKALADGIRDLIEAMRISFNEAGGLIPKMENYDVPHIHDSLTVRRAGFDRWFAEIDNRLDWNRIIDPLTGRAMPIDSRIGKPSDAMRKAYLKSSFDDIVFGRSEAVYGLPDGVATYRKHADQRHLHFKSGRDWMEYNRDFGTGGLSETLMSHVHRMARDIALMRDFGPNPKLGIKYEADLWKAKAKKGENVGLLDKISNDTDTALRMMNVQSGTATPTAGWMQWMAVTGSTSRSLVQASRLDRAVIASIADMNTVRSAAIAMGMNGNNAVAKLVGLLPSLSKSELARAQWVNDTLADGGAIMARFQQEFAPKEWANRVSQMSMRVQGLSWWTDRARSISYQEFSGFLDQHIGTAVADMNPVLRRHLEKWGITEQDWAAFARPENRFVADNGATFLMPIYWRNTTTMRPDLADRLYGKIMGATEDWMNEAVTTNSLLAQAFTDPAAIHLTPGHPGYELWKSATMFKTFPITFTVNQIRRFNDLGGMQSSQAWAHAGRIVGGATVLGAVSLQIGEIIAGRDPRGMADVNFWVDAALKGGGFAVLGDIVKTGQTSFGTGFAGYLAGPMAQTIQDVWGITLGTAITAIAAAANGEEVDTNWAKKFAKFGRDYTPMGQTPIVGPAIDNWIWYNLQKLLDPEAAKEIAKAEKARENRSGNAAWWMPGTSAPARLPDLGAMFR